MSESKTLSLLGDIGPIESAFAHWKFRQLPFGLFRDLRPRAWETVRTCNLGVYRDDLVKINGFDESYVSWGREDSDFVVRLLRHGLQVRSGRLAACVAHLYHRERSRQQLSDNEAHFQTCLSDQDHICSKSSILAEL